MSSLRKAGAWALAGFAFLFAGASTDGQERKGVISHPPLFKMVLPNTANQEVGVYEVEYEPGGMNPRHLQRDFKSAYDCSGQTRTSRSTPVTSAFASSGHVR
jgi:hypothetical protein